MGKDIVNIACGVHVHPDDGKTWLELTYGIDNSTGPDTHKCTPEGALEDDSGLVGAWEDVRDASGGTGAAFASSLQTNLPAVYATASGWSSGHQADLKRWFDGKRQRGATL